MKTLRLSLKLYNTFHADLLVLKECDVAFSSLVKLALYYRVRGRKLNIFIPECREYRYPYKRAFTKSVITIDVEGSFRTTACSISRTGGLEVSTCLGTAILLSAIREQEKQKESQKSSAPLLISPNGSPVTGPMIRVRYPVGMTQ